MDLLIAEPLLQGIGLLKIEMRAAEGATGPTPLGQELQQFAAAKGGATGRVPVAMVGAEQKMRAAVCHHIPGTAVNYGARTQNEEPLREIELPEAVKRIWMNWLARRRRRGFLSWTTFRRLLQRFALPPALLVHSVYRHAGEAAT
jgi:hypothetical protein